MAPRILIIDDEPHVGKHLTLALRKEAMVPIYASNAEEGLAKLKSEKIDLIVLDVGLPDINGFDLCKMIRRDSSVPIIFLSARDSEVDRILGLQIGGDDYVVKPFSFYELISRIKLRMRDRPVHHDDNEDKVASPFVILADKRIIIYYGEKAKLSFYGYEILVLLINRQERVFTREELKEKIWEEPESCTDRNIDTKIKEIRSVLGKIRPDIDPIKTHRGVGYSLRRFW